MYDIEKEVFYTGIGTLLWDSQSVSNMETLDNTVDSLLEQVASPTASSLLISLVSSFSSTSKDNPWSAKNVVTFVLMDVFKY